MDPVADENLKCPKKNSYHFVSNFISRVKFPCQNHCPKKNKIKINKNGKQS